MTPSAHPLGEAWERVRSPATPWLGGRNIHDRFSRDWKPAGAAPGAQTPARPSARPPAWGSQATDRRGSRRGPSPAAGAAACPPRRGSLLTGHWVRPPGRGRRRARPARPRRTCPPCRLRSRRCPRRGLSSCLAGATEARAQARHSPMPAARRVPASPAVPAARPGLGRQVHARWAGLGRGLFR